MVYLTNKLGDDDKKLTRLPAGRKLAVTARSGEEKVRS